MFAESPSLRYCLPLLAGISGGVLFFQGYFISNFAVMKIALVEMKIDKELSLPKGVGMWASVFDLGVVICFSSFACHHQFADDWLRKKSIYS